MAGTFEDEIGQISARASQPRAAVVIATKGRPSATPKVLEFLARQTVLPQTVVLSATNEADIGEWSCNTLTVTCIYGTAGLTVQRNRALDTLGPDIDVVIFFDDDYAPCRDWIERCLRVFQNNPSVVGLFGLTLKDGATALPVTWDEAQRIVHEADGTVAGPELLMPCSSLYGCNMACRLSPAKGVRFDERLVLYGWLEDKDFSRRLTRKGLLVWCEQLRGVHLGLVSGRISGKRFGYSQVVNAHYLLRKGVMSRREATRNITMALVVNTLKSIRPEAHLDRRGRLLGNLIGLMAICRGSCDPEHATRI